MDWAHSLGPFTALGNIPTPVLTWRLSGTGADPIGQDDLLCVNVQLWAQFSEHLLWECLWAFAHAVPFTCTPTHCLVSSSLSA